MNPASAGGLRVVQASLTDAVARLEVTQGDAVLYVDTDSAIVDVAWAIAGALASRAGAGGCARQGGRHLSVVR